MTKRLERLSAWIEANPYRVHATYRDTISDEQAQMLLDGEFEAFNESVWEWEINTSDYVDWSEWEAEFASEAGYDEWDAMPEWLQDYASETRWVDCSDLIEGAVSNWSGHVAATVYKRNGELIEFQGAWGQWWDKRAAEYLKRHCGIDPHASEPTYAGTYLKAIGTIDLLPIYKAQRAPIAVLMSPRQHTIGHEPLNGSGTMGDDQYKGRERYMRATFRVDSLDRYGIDSVFGLTGSMWCDCMTVRLAR
jgi:hypothetical protein